MPKVDDQMTLFDIPEPWAEEWQGMPEFENEDQLPFRTVSIHFENAADVEAFSKLIGQKLPAARQYNWYPEATIQSVKDKRWVDDES